MGRLVHIYTHYGVINIVETCFNVDIKGSIVCVKLYSLWAFENKHVHYSWCFSLPAFPYLTDFIDLYRS
jgi:hypothetical protein